MTPPNRELERRHVPLSPLPSSGKPSLDLLAQVPEESLWLANFTSEKTRETYRQAIRQFIEAAGLKKRDDFRRVSRGAVMAWRDQLTREGRSRRTVKNRLSALSSLFDHLAAHGVVEKNVVKEVDRPSSRPRLASPRPCRWTRRGSSSTPRPRTPSAASATGRFLRWASRSEPGERRSPGAWSATSTKNRGSPPSCSTGKAALTGRS